MTGIDTSLTTTHRDVVTRPTGEDVTRSLVVRRRYDAPVEEV